MLQNLVPSNGTGIVETLSPVLIILSVFSLLVVVLVALAGASALRHRWIVQEIYHLHREFFGPDEAR